MNNKTIKNLLSMAVLATATTGAWGAAAPYKIAKTLDETTEPCPFLLLPKELQHRILELAVDKDPKTYASVACASRDLNAICKDEFFKRDFLRSVITYKNCPELKDFIHNPAPEKLKQKIMFKGEEFTLKEVVESCEVLSLRNLGLRQIPVGLKYCVNLKQLFLSQNYFSSPEAIESFLILGELKKLEKLDLRSCGLSQIPLALGSLSELKGLAISCNNFSSGEATESFKELSNLSKLEKLELTFCHLKQIPPGLGALNGLKELNLSDNNFSSAAATESFNELSNLSKLEKLELKGCGLKQIPPGLGALRELKELDIANNDFNSADATKSFNELSTLSKLERLRLFLCDLKQIPPALSALSELKELVITYNDFSSAEATKSFNELSTLSKLEKLELKGCGLKQIPPVVGALRELKELDIANNDFNSADATKSFNELSTLSKLERLRLFLCDLKQIPPVVGALSELKELSIGCNDFSSADATESFKELIKLSKLEVLSLAGCHLKQIPPVLGLLSELKELIIESNDFSSADATESFKELIKLSKLEKLDLYNCNLKQIPPGLFELNELKELALGGNTVDTDAFKRARPDVKLIFK